MKKPQKSLANWTKQDWRTKSGKPSKQTGERYLPASAIKALIAFGICATTAAKRKGTAAGKQFVKQPKSDIKENRQVQTGSLMLNLLIGPIAEIAGTWMSGKVEQTKANAQTKVAKAQAEAVVMQKKATGEIDWDLEMAKGSANSWKDEWLTILFSIPLILAFVPGMEDVVANGFARLNEMPEWYQYSLGVIVAASFGVRSATKFFGKK